MKIVRDHFSAQSGSYVQFRPGYPADMVDHIVSLCKEHHLAWDCGTGNGQLAVSLADHFSTVYATDTSAEQLDHATQRDNIIYIEEAAEATDFDDQMFDLITVAQAIHWFHFDRFYAEVKRTLRPDGIIAVIGYNLPAIDPETDAIIRKFYTDIVGPYWDSERRYIDENYTTIPFPFKEIEAPTFSNSYEWNLQQLTGYLRTWSAVQHYQKKNNADPVSLIEKDLEQHLQGSTFTVQFPMLLRIGTLQ